MRNVKGNEREEIMTEGLHWEWRGFGTVTGRFVKSYCDLPILFEQQEVEDLYLWIPGLEVNAKFRTGAEGGLKLKRIRDRDGCFEKWHEDPGEIFDFPLNPRAWKSLSDVLKTANLHLPDSPDEEITRERAVKLLTESGCKTLLVKKTREAKKWQAPNGFVKLEWASVSGPQPVVSIGLENWYDEDAPAELSDESAKKDLSSAVDFFELNREPLKIMNYMKAVELWSDEQFIF